MSVKMMRVSAYLVSVSDQTWESPQVVIVGTGYVGLTTGACLAHLGARVTCCDVDAHKIGQLRNGVMPITWISPSIPLSFDTLPYSKDVGLRGGRQLLELTLLISCDPCGRVAHVGPVPVSAPGHGVIV